MGRIILAQGGIESLGFRGHLTLDFPAVFLTLNLTPVAYIVSEAAAAASMHIVKAITYGRFNLMSWSIFLNGLFIGCAMMVGNFIALLLSAMPTRNAINVLSLAS